MFFKKKSVPQTERQRRAVTPTQRSTVFSYHTNRSPRQDAPARDMQAPARLQVPLAKVPWRRRLPLVAGLAALLFVAFLSLHVNTNARIVPIDSNKGQVFLRPVTTYEQAATQYLSGLANSNKLTINTKQIASQLTRQFPELTSTSVSLPIVGSQPTIFIQPATPRLVLATPSGGPYILDSSGRALIVSSQVKDLSNLQLPVVVDESGLKVALGAIALPRATVSFIAEVAEQLRAKKLTVSSLVLPVGSNELHVRINGAGYYIKYNVYGNAREEAGAHLALKERLEQQKLIPREYIDVRVEGRGYYK
jgi:hypothetical protein